MHPFSCPRGLQLNVGGSVNCRIRVDACRFSVNELLSSPFLIETSHRERHEMWLAERTSGRRADGWCAGALLAAGTVPGAVARRIAGIIT